MKLLCPKLNENDKLFMGNPDLDDVRRLFINTKILIPLFLNYSSSVRQFVIRLSFLVA